MDILDEVRDRIAKDIKRYEGKLRAMDVKRRRIRRKEDQVAYHRRNADLQGKIRGLKYALEHIKVAEKMAKRGTS